MLRLMTGFFALALCAAPGLAAWDPAAFDAAETLELRTISADEGEHWSTVWLVVIDSQVYIRLGSRAAARMEKNTTNPTVTVRIAGQTFEGVTAESVPAMAAPVAAAMREKYWTDIFVRYMNHPLTMRLKPAAN